MPKMGIPAKRDYFHVVLPKLKEIENMIAYGYKVRDIAEMLGVSPKTYSKWKNQYSELEILHADGKTKNIAKLKKTGLQEALGYEYTEKHIEEIHELDADGEVIRTTHRKVKTVKKRHRGNAQLIIFLLCNWAPEEFKRQDTEEIIKTLQVFMSKEVKDVYGE